MAVDTTLLMEAVDDVTRRHPSNTHFRFELTIYAGEELITPIRIDAITCSRDYESKFSDVMTIDALIGAGDLAYGLQPHRDTLMVDLFTVPVGDLGGGDSDRTIEYRRYRAVLLEKDAPSFTDPRPHSDNRSDLNQSMAKLQLQLIEETVYQLLMITIGRLYRKLSPMDALRAVLTEVKDWPTVGQNDRVRGVDVVPGYQTKVRETINIPPTRVSKVVDVLQYEEGGLYATGVGNYLQNRMWYVYPLFDITRASKESGVLTIYRIPPNRALGSEKTFAVDEDGGVDIIAAGTVEIIDAGRDKQLTMGNAVRMGNAHQLLSSGKAEDNRFTAERKENMYEVRGTPVDEEGLVNAQWSSTRSTSNPFPEYSRLAERNGQYMVVEWNHSVPDVLRPGMPVIFYSAVDGRLKRLQGTLCGVNHQYVPGREGVNVDFYVGRAYLKVFIERSQ